MRRRSGVKQAPRFSIRLAIGLLVLPILLASALSAAAGPAAPRPIAARVSSTPFSAFNPTFGSAHTIAYDKYSLKIDGQRTPIWSAEFHPNFRLPSPGLWRDVFEKLKASGFNAVSIYFDWGLSSPAPGIYDFSGIRDIDKVLTLAEQTGLYVIARPGPYLNSEIDGGGLPPWLARVGAARNHVGSAAWLHATSEWMNHVTPIIARHQISRGGSVIMFQIENEYSSVCAICNASTVDPDPAASDNYIHGLVRLVHARGIKVPLSWNSQSSPSVGKYADIIPLGGYDTYSHVPQLAVGCTDQAVLEATGARSPITSGQSKSITRRRPDSPIMTPEIGGLAGVSFWGGPGYDACYRLGDVPVQRQDDLSLLAGGETITNHFMGYGGSNWGWQSMATNTSSNDLGSPIDEARQLTPKATYNKEIGYRLRSFPDLAMTDDAGTPAGSNSDLLFGLRSNPTTKAQVIVLRHAQAQDPRSSSTTLSLTLPDGSYPRVPQAGAGIAVNGMDAKMLLAGSNVEHQRLVYSTSEPFFATHIDQRDYVGFVGRRGDSGETVLRYKSRPTVRVLSGTVGVSWDSGRRDLRVNYSHSGLQKVLISGGGRTPTLLLLADDDDAAGVWLGDDPSNPSLAIGPYLVRHIRASATGLDLSGQTAARLPRSGDIGGATGTVAWSGDLTQPADPTNLELYTQTPRIAVRWNGRSLATTSHPDGLVTASLAGPPPVVPPSLTNWRFHTDTPEAAPTFDDHTWTSIPAQASLLADTYGFHHGNIWYRGSFTATGAETAATFVARTGGAPAGFMVWLNGTFLGSSTETASSTYLSPDLSTATVPLTAALRIGGRNVLSVLVENGGHPIVSATSLVPGTPMGLQSVTLAGPPTAITWKIQGTAGGEHPKDSVRGAFNNGGLSGERDGWTLPSYRDTSWAPVSLPDQWASRSVPQGVAWYRTQVQLNLPHGTDIPLGLRLDDDRTKDYEALLFVNGWMIGRYANALGPQHLFPVPEGILQPRGNNTIAIAVLSRGPINTAGLGAVRLQAYGRYNGSAFSGVDAAGSFPRSLQKPTTADQPHPAGPGLAATGMPSAFTAMGGTLLGFSLFLLRRTRAHHSPRRR